MSKNTSKDIGTEGEDAASKYLISLGYQILERNFRSSQGEIDIIAKEKEFLVFLEIKNYSFRSYGSPLGAIRYHKKQSLKHAANTYLYKNNIKNTFCRFDAIGIYKSKSGKEFVEHIKNAFVIN